MEAGHGVQSETRKDAGHRRKTPVNENPFWRGAVVAVAALAAASGLVAQERRTYPGARTGGNYMHAYYLPPAPSSTPWAPSWSPDGKAIAVGMSGSIWKVDPASGVARSEERREGEECRSRWLEVG